MGVFADGGHLKREGRGNKITAVTKVVRLKRGEGSGRLRASKN